MSGEGEFLNRLMSGVGLFPNGLRDKFGNQVTPEEIVRMCDPTGRIVTLTGATSLTHEKHGDRILLLGEVGGDAALAVTLPEATGSGVKFKFIVSVPNISGYTIVVADTTNANFCGNVVNQDADLVGTIAAITYLAPANADTITLNATSTGGLKGDWIEVVDIGTDLWFCTGIVTCPAGSNTATCFSAAV